jgi:hypothetical protein
MKNISKILLTILLGSILIPNTAFAYEGDISITSGSVQFSSTYITEGKKIRIYATASNTSTQDLLGTIQFFNKSTGNQIGSDQPISLFSERPDDVFVDWTPPVPGTYEIEAKIIPWETEIDNPSNNSASITAIVQKDTDRDGLANVDDEDDDNDGTIDQEDDFPEDKTEWEDTDDDGKGDNADLDDDNDGVLDEEDELPKDPLEWDDADDDGLGNNADPDDDNDGLSDLQEENLGTQALIADSDGDEVQDGEDDFPLDNTEWTDYDNDGIGNNADTDDDNDEISDADDYNPENKGPTIILFRTPKLAPLNSPVYLDASGSFDEDGSIMKMEWEVDGKKVEGNKIKHVFEEKGEYTIKVVATDDKGETRDLEIIVQAINYELYFQLCLILILIILALIIFFQYIKAAKKSR